MKEQISALMDDELDVTSSQHLFTALNSDSRLKECWSDYHLIGDLMRGNDCLSSDFHARLMQKLEQEPTVLAPRNLLGRIVKPSFMLSAGSAVAAVAFVGWVVWSQQRIESPEQAVTTTVAQNSVSPEAMNSYLLAHQEFSSSGDMQAASYVRPAALSGNGN
jgi:sigma-E factor negative regulatory protein RseA